VPRQKRVFTSEYRAEAVVLVVSGDRPIASIARDLGIGESTLGNWVAAARRNGTAAAPERPLDVNERAELKRLREELRIARMERDFLKKAALGSSGGCNTTGELVNGGSRGDASGPTGYVG